MMRMNPYAAEFIPSQPQLDLNKLWGFPFFRQRFERFLFTQYRIPDARLEDLQILMISPLIQAQHKAKVVFMGVYQTHKYSQSKSIPLLYEADRWDDPRTGAFVKIT